MAFSGGTFSRTFDCTTDRDNGVKILASKFDTELDGFATGLSTCILKDGTQTCTAAIPFAEGLTVPDNKTIVLGTNSDITIQYDESTNDSLEIAANVEGAALGIVLKADQGDDNADQWKLNIADGGTATLNSKISGSFVSQLTLTPNSTAASSTTAVAGNLTVGGDLTLGSGAVITEAELEKLDGITNGTVAADKAVVVDSNKDIGSFRNVTLTGELDAGSLDISGDADIDGTLEADAMTLNGTAITTTATLSTGISNNNVPIFTSGVADDDFLRVTGTAIEGRSASEVLSDIGGQASLTFGISNTNAVKIDSASVADDEYARFTANGLESRSNSEVLSDIGAAPAAGSSNIVTTGALNSGSITSGFGSIDNGSSAITTTGTITGGVVDADNLRLDGNTISSTDTNGDITLDPNGSGDVVVAQVASSSLDIEGDRTDAQITLKGGSAGAGIQLFGSTYTNYAGAMYLDATASTTGTNDAQMVFRTGSTPSEAMRIDRSGNVTFSQEASGSPYPEQKIKWSNDSTTANGFYVSQDTSRNGRVWHEQGVDLIFGTTNTERLRVDSSGNVTMASQPSVSARATATNLAVGSQTTLTLDNERYDIGSNLASNTFTAPVTGKYLFTYTFYFVDVDTANTALGVQVVTSNTVYENWISPDHIGNSDFFYTATSAQIADMDVNDTLQFKVYVSAGAAQTDVHADSKISIALLS